MHVSIIIPTLNEAKSLPATLNNVMALAPKAQEIIVVDGGSTDNTLTIAQQYPVKILHTQKPCRALQMNAGAQVATGDYLCFLHADTLVPKNLVTIIRQTLSDDKLALAGFTSIMKGERKTRYFTSFLNFTKTYFVPLIYRPDLFFFKGLRLLFGDQVMFCRKKDFFAIRGFNGQITIMEEPDLCLRMNKLGRIKQIHHHVESSDRRLTQWGFFKSYCIWISICLLWAIGVPDRYLKRFYKEIR